MNPLIFQSDFGRADGAVSAMYGVAYCVCGDLKISDLTHEIPNMIFGSLLQADSDGKLLAGSAVFVSVVDPGVGSTRRSIVAQTEGGQYVVTPDNGTLTHIKKLCGIRAARVIDESVNRLPAQGKAIPSTAGISMPMAPTERRPDIPRSIPAGACIWLLDSAP